VVITRTDARPPHGRPHRRRDIARVSGLAALMVVGALLASCASSQRLSNDTLPPLYTGPSTSAPPTTAPIVSGPPGASTPATATLPPESSLPTGTTAVLPSTIPGTHTTWGGWAYYEVPRLGTEPVRGTGVGCTNGGLGNTLPDGVWNVLIGDGTGSNSFWTSSQITVDVRCVYTGAAGKQRHDAACTADPSGADCSFQTADWFVVNNSTRLRTMPVASGVLYGVGALGASTCPGAELDRNSPAAPWRTMDSWIVVDSGRVTTVVTACPGG
jgi:hypothetical protein